MRAFDIDRPGQRMHDTQVGVLQIGRGSGRADKAVKGIPCFQTDHLAGLDFRDRLDIGMPAVMATSRFFLEGFGTVNRNIGGGLNTHGFSSPPSHGFSSGSCFLAQPSAYGLSSLRLRATRVNFHAPSACLASSLS